LGYFTFNTSTWDNDGTTPATAPSETVGLLSIPLYRDVMVNLQTNKKRAVGILSFYLYPG
jgi:hypothetical protein